MGRLVEVWVELPGEIPDRETLVRAFERHFHRRWEDVLVGAAQPPAYQLAWEGYLAVSGMAPVRAGLTLRDLTDRDRRQAAAVFNIVVG